MWGEGYTVRCGECGLPLSLPVQLHGDAETWMHPVGEYNELEPDSRVDGSWFRLALSNDPPLFLSPLSLHPLFHYSSLFLSSVPLVSLYFPLFSSLFPPFLSHSHPSLSVPPFLVLPLSSPLLPPSRTFCPLLSLFSTLPLSSPRSSPFVYLFNYLPLCFPSRLRPLYLSLPPTFRTLRHPTSSTFSRSSRPLSGPLSLPLFLLVPPSRAPHLRPAVSRRLYAASGVTLNSGPASGQSERGEDRAEVDTRVRSPVVSCVEWDSGGYRKRKRFDGCS